MLGSEKQVLPVQSSGDITELVIEDLRARRELGKGKYGTTLQAFNGRNSLLDAYQEALDLVQYLRQRLEEEGSDERIEKLHKPNVQVYRQILLELGRMHLTDLTQEAHRRGVVLSTQGRDARLKVRDSLARAKYFINYGSNVWGAVANE